MKKRILSMLLVLCMVFSMVPTAAFATEEIPCDKACTDTDGDGAINHTEDCAYKPATEEIPAVEGADCTHECELCKTVVKFTPPVAKECNCTVKCTIADDENGIEESINADCPLCSAENADLTECKGGEPISMTALRSSPNSTKITTGLDFTTEYGNTPPVDCTVAGIDHVHSDEADKCFTWQDNTLTLNNVEISVPSGDGITLPITDVDIILNGANTIKTYGPQNHGIYSNSQINISGTGSLDATSIFADGGTINIHGGTITTDGLIYSNSCVNILGGEVTSGGGIGIVLDISGADTVVTATSNSYVFSEAIYVKNGATVIASTSSTDETIGAFRQAPTISGYTNLKVTAGADKASAQVVAMPTNDTYTKNKYVKIEESAPNPATFDELQAAVKTATPGGTITLGADIDSAGVLTIDKKLTLDLNGQKLKNVTNMGNTINVLPNAELIITDSAGDGELSLNADYFNGYVINNEGTLTVSSGTVSLEKGSAAINNTSPGKVIISGGTVSASIENYATLEVEGGTVSSEIKNYGTLTVSGGTVSSRETAIANYGETATTNICGTAKVTGAIIENGGTIYIGDVPNPAKTVLTISDAATVENTENQYAVYFGDQDVTADNVGSYYKNTSTGTVGKVYPEPAASSSHSVTYKLTNVANQDNLPTAVADGGTLTVMLKEKDNYALPRAITVTIDGTTLTNGYTYNRYTGNITVNNVTGDVVITAAGVKKETTPTTAPSIPVTTPTVVGEPAETGNQLRTVTEALTGAEENKAKSKLSLGSNDKLALAEVELQVSTDNGRSWTKAIATDIKGGNVKVFMAYPAGTNSQTHTLTIYHYASGVDKAPTALATTTNDTLGAASATVNRFSPFAIVAVPKSTGGGSSGVSSYDYYDIKITKEGNGSISPDSGSDGILSVREWSDRTFTFTPDKGYVVSDVLVDGKSIGAKANYTFKDVTKDHTLKVIFKASSNGHVNPQTGVAFEDVQENDWFVDSVYHAVNKGWFRGTSKTAFSPYGNTTRGMIATVLWRMEKEPTASVTSIFEDVASGAYYAAGVNWAQESGIVGGYGNGKFGPDDNITREQMASILYRYAQFKGYNVSKHSTLTEFADADTISDYAKSPMAWAVENNLISGKGNGILDPRGKATRAEVATIITRFDEMLSEK